MLIRKSRILILAACLIFIGLCLSGCVGSRYPEGYYDPQISPLTFEKYEQLKNYEICIKSIEFYYVNSDMVTMEERRHVNHSLLIHGGQHPGLLHLPQIESYAALYRSDDIDMKWEWQKKTIRFVDYKLPKDKVNDIMGYLESHKSYFFNQMEVDQKQAQNRIDEELRSERWANHRIKYPANFIDADKKETSEKSISVTTLSSTLPFYK